MSITEDGSNFDHTTFDVDAWIDDVVRPEVTVELYPYDIDFGIRLKAIQEQIPAAEKTKPEDRGLDDPSPEALLAQIQELKDERARTALHVRVRQLTTSEMAAAAAEAANANATPQDAPLYVIAAACVEPTFTAQQLKRLKSRDRSGEGMIDQLIDALNTLSLGLPVPS